MEQVGGAGAEPAAGVCRFQSRAWLTCRTVAAAAAPCDTMTQAVATCMLPRPACNAPTYLVVPAEHGGLQVASSGLQVERGLGALAAGDARKGGEPLLQRGSLLRRQRLRRLQHAQQLAVQRQQRGQRRRGARQAQPRQLLLHCRAGHYCCGALVLAAAQQLLPSHCSRLSLARVLWALGW